MLSIYFCGSDAYFIRHGKNGKKFHENRQKIRPKQILNQNPLKDAEAFKPFEQNVKKYTVVGPVEKNIFSKLIHNILKQNNHIK